MPGQDHGGDLVPQFGVGEAGPRLRVPRGAEQVEQVARLVRHGFGQTGPHDGLDQPHPAGLEPAAAEVAEGRDGGRQEQVEQPGPGVADGELGQHPAHGLAMGAHFQREHGAAGDVEGQALHGRQQVDRRRGVHHPDRRPGRGCDVGGQRGQDARGEGRGDGAALETPALALRQQQPLAGDGAEDADRGRGAAVVPRVGHQDMVNGVGRVEQEIVAAEEPALRDVPPVGVLGPDHQGVRADRP